MVSTLLGRIDRISDEFRADIGASEKRVMGAIDTVGREAIEYSKAHAAEHAQRRADVDARLSKLAEFMQARELQQAR